MNGEPYALNAVTSGKTPCSPLNMGLSDPISGQDILHKRQIFVPAINWTSECPASSPVTILTELYQLQKEKHNIQIKAVLTQNNGKGFSCFAFFFSWWFLPFLATCFVDFINCESGTSCTFAFFLGTSHPGAGSLLLWKFHFSGRANGRATLLYWTGRLLIINRCCSIPTNLLWWGNKM